MDEFDNNDLVQLMNTDPFEEEHGVSVAARIIYQLGEQLISDEFVALAELIKNSYDADCTVVKITIDTTALTPHGQGRIVIEDNGNGMTKDLMTQNFLRISTSFKKVFKYSPYFKRRTLGEKGLGRLSIQRLGNHLSLVTTPRIDRIKEIVSEKDIEFAKKYNQYKLDINWNQFKESEGDLSTIKAKCSFLNNDSPRYGTRIVIEGIRNLDFWYINRKLETRIKTEIFGMVNPFVQNNKQRFQINIEVDGTSFSNSKIDENVLDKMSDIMVEFYLEDRILNIEIQFRKRYIDRLLNDFLVRMGKRGFKKYTIFQEYLAQDEKIEINIETDKLAIDFPYLKEIKLQKHYDGEKGIEELAYPGDFNGKLFISDQSGEAYNESLILLQKNNLAFKTIKELKAIWQAAVGVYLFRNDFRIFPYGPEHDWLGVTARAQRLKANALKEHTISGYVQLDSISSEKITEQTNRYGLIEDEYGKNFFTLVRSIIAEIVTRLDMKLRANFNIGEITEASNKIESNDKNIIFERIIDRDEQKKSIISQVKQVTSDLTENGVSKSNTLNIKLKEIENKLNQLEKLNTEDQEERKQESFTTQQRIIDLRALVGLAGQGMIVESLTHELHRIESNIRYYAKSSKDIISLTSNEDRKNELLDYQDSIIQEVFYLQQQLEHLEPTYKKNSLILEPIDLNKLLKSLYIGNNPMAKKASISNVAVYVIGEEFVIESNKGLLITIFDNLFLNSLYWVSMGVTERKIVFELDAFNKSVIVYDSGPGVHKDIHNILFQPYESMKQDGRGLGLYIVKELMNSINANIYLDTTEKNRYENYYKFMLSF
ncbi:sensor histidine kinase [Paenibacillus sp. NRS-1760]|uniref:sensor histidine kinase n=1 Tax=Paenibacillus sp. NRS-1760 TaxID=3233902 RepID=UPI003D2A97B0